MTKCRPGRKRRQRSERKSWERGGGGREGKATPPRAPRPSHQPREGGPGWGPGPAEREVRRGRDSREVVRPKGETEGGNDRETQRLRETENRKR